jgi:4-aminobutyrate aminotransferase-like enzyme
VTPTQIQDAKSHNVESPRGCRRHSKRHTVACAAVLAAIDEIIAQNLPARARQIESLITSSFTTLADQLNTEGHGVIGEVRGRGGVITIESIRPGSAEPEPDWPKMLAQRHCKKASSS